MRSKLIRIGTNKRRDPSEEGAEEAVKTKKKQKKCLTAFFSFPRTRNQPDYLPKTN